MMLFLRATFFLISLLVMSVSMAQVPVVLSGPVPALQSGYAPGSSTILIYTITNNVPRLSAPISINGLSSPVSRVSVASDCGNFLPAANSTCQVGIQIAPQTQDGGRSINQTLSIDYKGRVPLIGNMVFLVSGGDITLISIAISPTNPTLYAGTAVNFTAIGTYSNGTTLDLTHSVIWNSTLPSVVAISNDSGLQGLASAILPGTSTISATDALHTVVSNSVILNVGGCNADADCPSGQFCLPPVCSNFCASSDQCPVGQHCSAGVCTL